MYNWSFNCSTHRLFPDKGFQKIELKHQIKSYIFTEKRFYKPKRQYIMLQGRWHTNKKNVNRYC